MNYQKTMLVGYTGFVGSNLDAAYDFTYRINSKNVAESVGVNPDLLIYAGLRAEKYLANNAPEKDFESIVQAFDQIKAIQPKKLVLISTVDVYKEPVAVDENTVIDIEGCGAYGANRFRLEQMLRDEYPDCLIVRLPGLYGKNLKKNFIYDFINVIPAMLKKEKYEELSKKSTLINSSYELQDNGFYKCVNPSKELKEEFKNAGFTALNFTDSRGSFQFYNLSNLMDNIWTALENDIRLLNISTEPVSVGEIYKRVTGESFTNEIAQQPPKYDYKSVYADIFGGANGYFFDKETVLSDIAEYISTNSR